VSVAVTAVRGGRDLKAFIDLPYRLNANHPLWVPPLKLERRLFLSRRINAFFTHGEAEYFLARRDGRVVGRISAQVNDAFNDAQGKRWGWFGFLEFEDDAEVLDALLDAAAQWLEGRGEERMVGPASFTMNDESGVLIEGFELRPMIAQPWNPPYYQQRLEQAGMRKAMDLLMWNLEVSDRSKVLPVIFELADKVQSEHGIRVRPMRRRQLRKDLDAFAAIYNAAWSKNWDFVPYSKKDLDALAQELQLVFDKHWFFIAEKEDTGEVVGVAMTIPDPNQVFEKMKGRLLPFGWLYFLRKGRYIDRVRVGWLGVKPEHQHTGVAAKLYVEHLNAAATRPQSGGEMGWILETNTAMNRGMEAMGGRVVKRYRIYERMLGGAGEPNAASAEASAPNAAAAGAEARSEGLGAAP
jgi:GNAT superfamily N-acetyltransferase